SRASWLHVAAEHEIRVTAYFAAGVTLRERVDRLDHRCADVSRSGHIQRVDHAQAAEVTANDHAGAVARQSHDVPCPLLEAAVTTEQILLDVREIERRYREMVFGGVLADRLDRPVAGDVAHDRHDQVPRLHRSYELERFFLG